MKCPNCGAQVTSYKSFIREGRVINRCRECLDFEIPTRSIRTHMPAVGGYPGTEAHVRDIKSRRLSPDGSGEVIKDPLGKYKDLPSR